MAFNEEIIGIKVVADIDDAEKALGKKLPATLKDLDKSIKNTGEEFLDFDDVLTGIGLGAGMFTFESAMAGVNEVIFGSIDAFMESERVLKQVKFAYGNTSNDVVQYMKYMAQNTIYDDEQIGQAFVRTSFKAKELGLTIQQQFNLIQGATDLAAASGQNFETILIGMLQNLSGGKSKILTQLGIDAQTYADMMKEAAKQTGAAADQMNGLEGSLANVKKQWTEFQEGPLGSFLAEIAPPVIKALSLFVTGLEIIFDTLVMIGKALGELIPLGKLFSYWFGEGEAWSAGDTKKELGKVWDEYSNKMYDISTRDKKIDLPTPSGTTGKTGVASLSIDEQTYAVENQNIAETDLYTARNSSKELTNTLSTVEKNKNSLTFEDIQLTQKLVSENFNVANQLKSNLIPSMTLQKESGEKLKITTDGLINYMKDQNIITNDTATALKKEFNPSIKELLDMISSSKTGLTKFGGMVGGAKVAMGQGPMMKVGNSWVSAPGGTRASSSTSAGKSHEDFVMRPGQGAVNFSPNDTLIGVKNPNSLMGGGGGTIVNIQNVYGIDAHQIAEELQRELSFKVRR